MQEFAVSLNVSKAAMAHTPSRMLHLQLNEIDHFLQSSLSIFKCSVKTETSELGTGAIHTREEWRSVSTRPGVLCAMTFGKTLMPVWHVDNWDFLHKVSASASHNYTLSLMHTQLTI